MTELAEVLLSGVDTLCTPDLSEYEVVIVPNAWSARKPHKHGGWMRRVAAAGHVRWVCDGCGYTTPRDDQ